VRDYITLIEKIQQLPSSPKVIVCSVPPILIDYPNGLNAKRQKSINLLVKKAADIAGADFFDINTQLVNASSLFIDGIHPNIDGAQKIASLIFKKISNL
jgi:sialate O-acetylesterase